MCVPKPERSVSRRQIDADASSLNRPLYVELNSDRGQFISKPLHKEITPFETRFYYNCEYHKGTYVDLKRGSKCTSLYASLRIRFMSVLHNLKSIPSIASYLISLWICRLPKRLKNTIRLINNDAMHPFTYTMILIQAILRTFFSNSDCLSVVLCLVYLWVCLFL